MYYRGGMLLGEVAVDMVAPPPRPSTVPAALQQTMPLADVLNLISKPPGSAPPFIPYKPVSWVTPASSLVPEVTALPLWGCTFVGIRLCGDTPLWWHLRLRVCLLLLYSQVVQRLQRRCSMTTVLLKRGTCVMWWHMSGSVQINPHSHTCNSGVVPLPPMCTLTVKQFAVLCLMSTLTRSLSRCRT